MEDKYESGTSWRYEWEVSYTAKKIAEIMASRGFDIGNILGIDVTKDLRQEEPLNWLSGEVKVKGYIKTAIPEVFKSRQPVVLYYHRCRCVGKNR